MVVLNKAKQVPSGLFYVRVVVRFSCDEVVRPMMEDGPGDPWQGYYRSYGVSAPSLTEATRIIEDELWKLRPGGGEDDPLCSIESFDMEILDPDAIEIDSDWKRRPGVHFVSGKIFYGGDDTPADNDPAGVDAIREAIREGEEEE